VVVADRVHLGVATVAREREAGKAADAVAAVVGAAVVAVVAGVEAVAAGVEAVAAGVEGEP